MNHKKMPQPGVVALTCARCGNIVGVTAAAAPQPGYICRQCRALADAAECALSSIVARLAATGRAGSLGDLQQLTGLDTLQCAAALAELQDAGLIQVDIRLCNPETV